MRLKSGLNLEILNTSLTVSNHIWDASEILTAAQMFKFGLRTESMKFDLPWAQENRGCNTQIQEVIINFLQNNPLDLQKH